MWNKALGCKTPWRSRKQYKTQSNKLGFTECHQEMNDFIQDNLAMATGKRGWGANDKGT